MFHSPSNVYAPDSTDFSVMKPSSSFPMSRPIITRNFGFAVTGCLLLAGKAAAHEHHSDEIPEGERISADPIVHPTL